MKRISTVFVFTLAGTFLAVTAHAQYNSFYCSNQTTAGTYVVTCSGFVTPAPNASPLPMTILGVVVGDQDGVFKGAVTNSVGGTVFPQSVSGQSNTQPDCTGTVTYNKGQADEINIKYVIVTNGEEIRGMVVDKGANLSCTLKRIRA